MKKDASILCDLAEIKWLSGSRRRSPGHDDGKSENVKEEKDEKKEEIPLEEKEKEEKKEEESVKKEEKVEKEVTTGDTSG